MFQTFQLFLTELPYMFQTFNFFKFEQLTFFNVFVEQLQFEQLIIGLKIASARNDFWGGFRAVSFFLASARTVSSSQDFGVEQFFRADEFRAVDPSPLVTHAYRPYQNSIQNYKVQNSFIEFRYNTI